MRPDADAPLINIRPTTLSIPVSMPNGTIIHSTEIAELDIPCLPAAARIVHIFPDLASVSLISIGQLCDAGCEATFTATSVIISHNQQVVLTGSRSAATRLWNLPLTTPTPADQANAMHLSATPAELVAFAHAALFSPAISTLTTALDRNYITGFPGLTKTLLKKHPPISDAMVKGHLDQVRKNSNSTKSTRTVAFTDLSNVPPALRLDDGPDDSFPAPLTSGDRTHHCYAATFEAQGQVHSDQTGRFVIPSSQGVNYLMVVYSYDANYIHVEPMKNKSAPELVSAYKRAFAALCKAGLRPKLQRLDNECSALLKQFLSDESIDFQLAPPGIHRRNAAERAIRTAKNHFIAGLCSVDKAFPLHLWCSLLPQLELTLNLLRGSRINPKLSAYAQMHGAFDYNRTPIAPPGIRILAHVKPSDRDTWAPHALDGWYVGPALDSYRCYRVWIADTRAERICDTLEWFPSKVTMPVASSVDRILAATKDLIMALQNPTNSSPLSPRADSELALLDTLSEVLTSFEANMSRPAIRATQTPPTSILRVKEAAPSLRVFADNDPNPITDSTPPPHYQDLTGPVGRRNRRNRRKATPTPTRHTTTPVPAPAAIPTPAPPASEWISVPPRRSNRIRNVQPSANLVTGQQPEPSIDSNIIPDHDDALLSLTSTEVSYAATLLRETAFKAIHPDTGAAVDYPALRSSSEGPEWEQATADEIGRLTQGNAPRTLSGTETMRFIHVHDMPAGRTATYLKIVAADKPNKIETKRIRFTVGGDRINFEGDASTKTAGIITVKCLLNSVVSTPTAKFMTIDITDFYLNTPMSKFEYMRIPVRDIPACIMEQYQLWDKVHNGFVYVEISKGMYGIPHAGKIANDRLVLHLAKHGYHQAEHTHGLFTHEQRPVTFSLVVDDFGVKYTHREDAEHLITTLSSLYAITIDWTGAKYLGLTLQWDYTARTCDISMPGYIEQALQRFHVAPPTRPQHSPHAWQKPNYGAPTQLTDPIDTSPPLSPDAQTRIQEIIGVLLYYARAVDSTMLVALGTLASSQAACTQATADACVQLLNYAATHPDATVRYNASDMILAVDSDASYLSAPKARSRVAGYHYLSTNRPDPTTAPSSDDPSPHSTEPFTPLVGFSATSWVAPPKRSSEAFMSTAKTPLSFGPPCPRWAILSRPLSSKPTIAPPSASPMTLSNNVAPKPSTCDSTGFAIAFAKASSI